MVFPGSSRKMDKGEESFIREELEVCAVNPLPIGFQLINYAVVAMLLYLLSYISISRKWISSKSLLQILLEIQFLEQQIFSTEHFYIIEMLC